jgi:hypothetical protein
VVLVRCAVVILASPASLQTTEGADVVEVRASDLIAPA